MASGQSPGSNSIIVGNCVACEGLVRVSAKTKANADVRCPHCQQTFSLARLLESAVPEVEIVQPESSPTNSTAPTQQQGDLYIDKTSETGKDASGKFVVPSQLAKGARRRKSSRRSRSSRSGSGRSSRSGSDSSSSHRGSDSSYRSSESSRHSNSNSPSSDSPRRDSERSNDERTPASESASDTSRSDSFEYQSEPRESREGTGSSQRSGGGHDHEVRSHRSTRHRDKRAKEESDVDPNAAIALLKMLMGGLLALPIAYLLVMWVFSQDPLGIAKQLGERVPFVVPTALRAKPDETPATSKDFTDLQDDEVKEPNGFDPDFSNLNKIGEKALEGLNQ